MKQHLIGYFFALCIGFTGGYWFKSDVPMETQTVPAPIVQAQEPTPEPQSSTHDDYQVPSEPAPVAAAPDFKFQSLNDAIDTAKPFMTDTQGADVTKGAAILAVWGATNMSWKDLQAIPLGKYGLVMKDSASQMGKRLCVNGQVIEIQLDSTVSQKIYLGGMFADSGNLYRFIAVGSTGEIVANSRANFCGIVTGQQHYENSMGGVAHAVHLVGMFDLPENKKK